MRVLGEGRFAEESAVMKDANVVDHGRYTDVMAQLKEARSLLREQDVIMLAAIFDRCVMVTSCAHRISCLLISLYMFWQTTTKKKK